MNAHLREGYVVDRVYPSHFHREMLPVWLVSTLSALGRGTPDLRQPFTWLELGCGSGLTAVVAAAAHPHAQFIGIDFNAEAIAQAQALADAARVRNLRFHALSFAQAMAAQSSVLPACDFIVTHGVYSWVSEANRQAIRQLVAQRLAPGGLLYLAYMSQPGATGFSAAQRLMHLATQHQAGSSTERAQQALSLMQRLAAAGAGYFSEHPSAVRELQRLGEDEIGYVAHELLNAHWEALHVGDVMTGLEAAGCEWAGSATPLENIDAVSLPASTQPLLAELARSGASAAAIETFKDVARNQRQRRDIYQRARPQLGNVLSSDAHRDALLAQRVALLPAAQLPGATAAQGELSFDTQIGPVRLPLALVAPLLTALQPGPRSYAELARLPAYAGQPGFISQLLQMLAWAGWLHFTQAASAQAEEAVARLNAVLPRWPVPAGGPVQAVASLGTAVLTPP
ncbi:class I SAM-dependent methyltransferase [Xenophilus arseniciresistens]|uniref:Class I SAM-dependent methyltransferase n=1 Tax=Xenophilus arseniciresistens TaxID=1283306 RepID=A0AAE3NFS6_9BURK|nr:class I SAM-dependent methyltransferase [Xenophilus arseniciresistens]MDA7418844.1 class I SAM-dependent methyltransferase [Xenophilus arseniciresistens]